MKRQTANEPLEPLIHEFRGARILLDADLARLYGVPTHRFNEAFKRNRHRFPEDFAFRLTVEEFRMLMSQSARSSSQAPESKGHSRTGRHGGRRHLPWAFTEHGALKHDTALRDLYKKLLPLLQPPADPPKRRIGFHTE